MHVSNLFTNAPMVRLAERLVERSFGESVYFANSGAEANEAALKLVRKARPRGDIVSVHGAFHGRTYGALSATPQESKQAPFAPLVPGFRAVEPTAAAIAGTVDEHTAAVLLEPVQGESGVHPLGAEVLAAAREACDRGGRRAGVRRGPVRRRADRLAVGLRADRRRARRDDARQGPRRRHADRRARDRPEALRRLRAGRPRLDLRRRPGRARPPPTRCSTSSTTRASSPACTSAASGSPRA